MGTAHSDTLTIRKIPNLMRSPGSNDANEWYHAPGQSPGPGVAQATPSSAAEPRGMKPCFPGTRSDTGSYRRHKPRNDPDKIPGGISLAFRVVPQRSEERSRHTFGNPVFPRLFGFLAISVIILSLSACAGAVEEEPQGLLTPVEEKEETESAETAITVEAAESTDTTELKDTAESTDPVESKAVLVTKESDLTIVGTSIPDDGSTQLKPENELRPKASRGSGKPVEIGKPVEELQAEPLESAGREDTESAVQQIEKASIAPETPDPVNTSPAAAAILHPNPLLTEDRPYQPPNDTELKTNQPPSDIPAAELSQAADTPLIAPDAVSDPELDFSFNDPAVSAAAPSRLLESPGEFTISLEGSGWIFRSDRSSPGSWRFLERRIEGNSTAFRFIFTESGNWNLVFERQDLSSGGSENAVRNVMVGEDGGETFINNGPFPEPVDSPIPGIMPTDAASRNDAAITAADEGRIAEAMEYWEHDADRNDEAGIRARASLMEHAARSGSITALLTWLPEFLNDNPDPEILAEVLDVFEGQAGYEEPGKSVLEKLAETDEGLRRPEWLYRLAFYLEQPGENRDLDQSAAIYQEVITNWPLSNWRDKSEERLLWLQRHYFRVR